MLVNTNAAYGLYSQEVVLNDVVHTLNEAGFGNEDICMMLSPSHPIATQIKDASLFNSACESNAVTASLIGWLSEFGAVMIPTVGFFIRSQAFFHALMVSRETPALCGNSRTLAGLGFSDEEADRFEHQLRQNGVMVYVSCSENTRTTCAREVLRHAGAHEAATLDEKLRVVAAGATA
jgi:hypothetical protein